MQRFDGRRLWLHCICCHMTARSRQRAHKHNPRSNLFGSFIVDTTHILASAEMASLYLVFSQQRSCGNAALIPHTAHGVSSLKEYNCDCVAVALVQQFSTRSHVQSVQTPAHFTALQLVNCSPSPLHRRFYPRFEQAVDGAAMLVSIQYTQSTFTALIGA